MNKTIKKQNKRLKHKQQKHNRTTTQNKQTTKQIYI